MKIPQLIHLPTVDSTNNYAAKLMSSDLFIDGTVILADRQTEGRGQRGNSWQSKSKQQLTTSLCFLGDGIGPDSIFFMNKAIALGVHRFISLITDSQVFIKWPNDILVHDKKICGILTEIQWSGSKPLGIIVGVGLNIYHEENLNSSISLEVLNVNQLEQPLTYCEALYLALQESIQLFRSKQFEEINTAYHSFLWRKNVIQEAELLNGEVITGYIDSVNTDGMLEFIVTDNGNIKRVFDIKEIKFNY